MDTGFFKSKEFVLSALVAVVLVVGGAIATGVFLEPGVRTGQGCSVATPPGQALTPTLNDTGVAWDGDRFRRVVTYTLETPPTGPAVLNLCTDVGDIDIVPSVDGTYRLQATITNHGPGADEAVDRTRIEVTMTEDAGRLHIAAEQPRQVHSRYLFNSQSTRVTLELAVPGGLAHRLSASTDVGDLTLAATTYRSLALTTDVGDVHGEAVALEGDLEASTDVGDIELTLASVANATYDLATDVGDIDLVLPESPDVGYAIEARADVGHVRFDIGETEHHEIESHGATTEGSARSSGFTSKPIQVRIDATTDVGSIELTT